MLVLLLVLDGDGQFGLGPVQLSRGPFGRRFTFLRVHTAAADALQVLGGFDESVVATARRRELWRNERSRLLRLLSGGHRGHPTASRTGIFCEEKYGGVKRTDYVLGWLIAREAFGFQRAHHAYCVRFPTG